ncbi:MAG: cytochrome c3 family protein [Bacteroidia bacterium]|nr:cytochrome c3 family protein [Bacteroidia bacterium]
MIETLDLNFGIGQEATGGSLSVSRDSVYTSLAVIVGVLALVVVLLVFISANLINLIRVREGEEAYSFGGTLALTGRMLKNRSVAIGGNLVLFFGVIVFLTVTARGVGLHQGYQPVQPIKFSHTVHAGTLKMDCQYCHSGASLGKNAWIPSVNVCMNCHNASGVGEGTITGTEEIAKIREAYDTGVPVEWVRIHNLPDHAYFNHQQHVVAGKVACQTCHGPVETMDEVYQFSPLSMGWCINCHRTTRVDRDLYKILGREDAATVKTVEDIGGTNCARCHY